MRAGTVICPSLSRYASGGGGAQGDLLPGALIHRLIGPILWDKALSRTVPRMRALRCIAASFLATGCLAACSTEKQQPSVLAPVSPTPTVEATQSPQSTAPADPSPTPAIAAPVLPPESKAHTAAGAMAFVRHYFAVVDYAYASGDTVPLQAISDPECRPCGGIIAMVNSTTRVGGSYEPWSISISELAVPDGEPQGAIEVHMLYSADGGAELDSAGRVVHMLEATSNERVRVVLAAGDAKWLMYDYSVITR